MASNTPPTHQPPTPAPAPAKQRAEMWWVILAKSKTLRFFAVSCEFILFLGGLWITFSVTNPDSKNWFGGNVNMVFLTIMGWAVDAAMPEAWLHVVIQHVQQKRGHLSWSKFVAICISILFIGNIVYSVFTSGDKTSATGTPTDFTGWILLILIILRISVGFVYITVRQCQEWIDRTQEQPDPTPAPAPINVQEIVDQALAKATSEQHTVNEKLLSALEEVKTSQALLPAPPDQTVIITSVVEQLKHEMEVFLNNQVRVSETVETPQIPAPNTVSETLSTRVSNTQKQPVSPVSKHRNTPQRNSTTEIVRHSRKVSEEEVDAVVHPILSKDRSLTHRKIAPIVGLPETTVYLSVKRFRSQQDIVSGDLTEELETAETPESEENETAV